MMVTAIRGPLNGKIPVEAKTVMILEDEEEVFTITEVPGNLTGQEVVAGVSAKKQSWSIQWFIYRMTG